MLQTRGESEPTGDAPCQAGPAPTAELSSEAAVKLVDAGGASPLVQVPLVQALSLAKAVESAGILGSRTAVLDE